MRSPSFLPRGCGYATFAGRSLRVWQSDMNGTCTSQALFDPYSFAHAFAASLQFLLLPPPWLFDWKYGFAFNLGLHAAFELSENTPCVIRLCRAITPDTQYSGDSVVNSFGDLLTFALVYLLTWAFWNAAAFWAFSVPVATLGIFIGCEWFLGSSLRRCAGRPRVEESATATFP